VEFPVYEKVTTSDGNLAVAIFTGVESAAETSDVTPPADDVADGPGAAPVISAGPVEFQSFVSTLEEGADIVRNEALLGGESQYPGRQ